MSTIGDIVGASAAPPASSTTSASSKDQMGKDTFLKLLVAQMKYQDPSKPTEASQFIAQTAQFSMVEKLDELAKSQTDMLAAQLMLGASNLVGRTVTYTSLDGGDLTGVVTAATISGSSPTVRIGNKDVPLSSVKEVQTPTA